MALQKKISSGLLIDFSEVENYSYKEYGDVFKLMALYCLTELPKRIAKDCNPFVDVDEDYRHEYYNRFLEYINEGAKLNDNIIPQNNLVYDFICIDKDEEDEITLGLSATSIMICTVTRTNGINQYMMSQYLNVNFVIGFLKRFRRDVLVFNSRFKININNLDKILRSVKAYTLKPEAYNVNMQPIITEHFNYDDKYDVKELYDNRERVALTFAKVGETII